ncbi:DUF2268 domain-containing putative Zn-dependent protease [Mucilaginibacter sp. PPCGB 2223]|uniref:gliding motility protein GldB-related protein n=1 Tax=Mucilaginibacter sp. PPCGB 2223 TaxID=1886027 RepID=UPI001C30C3AA|nr:DUF2268 domain-containing putative Zn-dependent protease [Mucilaginibacter sp. PPCGB 2223]
MIFVYSSVSGQKIPTRNEVEKLADSSYQEKKYQAATILYESLLKRTDFLAKRSTIMYNIACCLNLQGKKDSALIMLKQAIKTGYGNKTNLLADKDLATLHADPNWAPIIKSVKESKKILNTDPRKVRLITEDIHRFWKAYDKALKDTAHFKQIFKKEYFDKASKGMDDYMSLKVSSIDFFVDHIKLAPQYYKAIRKTSLQVDNFKSTFTNSFVRLKELYPAAKFPDVYFLIGAFTSGGTVSNTGLLIGVNQYCKSDGIPTDELSFGLKTRMGDFKYLPNIIAHELIHYQQDGLKEDTTTLSYVIREGMADMIGELISGNNANAALHDWANGKEKMIWRRFEKDMYYNRYGNWIANSQQATPDNLPDQGYWVGYQICKAYYDKSDDKNKAVNDMLNIKDYKAFYEKSGVAKLFQ